MRTEISATGRLRFDSCAWVERFVRMLVRATICGSAKWRANRRCARYTSAVVRSGHRLSVAMSHERSRGAMLRVVCVTHRGSSCIGGVGFFMGDGRYNHSPMEKLWRAIRKSRCKKGG